MVLLLAVSTLSCAHCFRVFLRLSKYTFPLSIAPFSHSNFMCCSTPFFGVGTVSAKNSSLFSTSLFMFITYGKRQNMTYNDKGDASNSTSVIFFIGPM